MFLNFKTSHGHVIADAYSGLQKSIRSGNTEFSLYWASQIGNSINGCKGYPNALKKRLCQISLEDAASWTFASRLFKELPNGQKLKFEELIPWVIELSNLSKTHTTAWLNRIAAQEIYDNQLEDTGILFNINTSNETQFAVYSLIAHCSQNMASLKSACEKDGDLAVKLYKYINSDPLVFHAWQMEKRRVELSSRIIVIDKNASVDENIFLFPRELPDEWYDKHTKRGKFLNRGYKHFFEIMKLNPAVYEENCDPYESEAKVLYLTFKINGEEARVRHLVPVKKVKKAKKVKETKNNEIKEIEKNDEIYEEEKEEAFVSKSVESTLEDKSLFTIPLKTGSQLQGFKNFTVLGVLNHSINNTLLHEGDNVFIKMGESINNCLFAKACDDMRYELGLTNTFGKITIEWLVPSYINSIDELTIPLWANSVKKRMKKALMNYSDTKNKIPCLIMSVFDGEKLCRKPEWLQNGIELLKILLFRKYVGSSDTNGTNLMINENGNILSIDEGISDIKQLKNSNKKGLQTAQRIHSNLINKALQSLVENPIEVGEFIMKLTNLTLPSIILTENRLNETHMLPPFDTETINSLLNNDLNKSTIESMFPTKK